MKDSCCLGLVGTGAWLVFGSWLLSTVLAGRAHCSTCCRRRPLLAYVSTMLATPTCLPGTGGPLQSCSHCSTGAIWNQATLREECDLGYLAAAQPDYVMEEVLMLSPVWELLGSPSAVPRIRGSLWLLLDDKFCRVL